MARSCSCDRIFTCAAGDFGFRALPDVVQLLWYRLASAALQAEEKGHLRFPGRASGAVSRLLNRSEDAVAADLDALTALGWLDLTSDGRGVWIPGIRAAFSRSKRARPTGPRGGTPFKGETKASARPHCLSIAPNLPMQKARSE